MLRRLLWPGLVIVLVALGSTPAGATPLDAASRGLLRDLIRSGVLPPSMGRGDQTESQLCEQLASLGSPLAQALRDRLTCDLSSELGLGLGADVRVTSLDSDDTRLAPLFLDLNDDPDPTVRLQTTLRADANLSPSLLAEFRFRFDSEGKNDPHNRTRDFHQLGVSNNVDRAVLRWQGEPATVILGRTPLHWGPLDNGLLLSDTAPALDQVQAQLKWSGHLLRAVVAQLSSATDAGTTLRRYFYAHRVDLALGPVHLGFSEAAVVSGPNESLSLRYLNPIQFYAQAQVENDGDSGTQVNVFNAIDLEAHFGAWHPFGVLVVDDFQIDAEGRERYPHQLAWAAGTAWSHQAWRSTYEYRRLGSWTYLHRGAGTAWQHFDRPLGAAEGPDTDRHRWRNRWQPSRHLGLELGVERWRRGENRLWTQDDRAGHAGEAFPRGRVERRWVTHASAAWSPQPWVWIVGNVGFHSIRNVNNQPEHRDVWEFRLSLNVKSPTTHWRVGD